MRSKAKAAVMWSWEKPLLSGSGEGKEQRNWLFRYIFGTTRFPE
jgi:hypothetical protein